MKKFIPIIAICMATVCSFAAETYKFPGWKSNDIANIEKQIQICESAKTVYSLTICMIVGDFAKNGVPTTFDAYKATIEKNVKSAYAKCGITNETTIINKIEHAILQTALCRNEFIKEASALALNSSNSYAFFYYSSDKTDGIIPPATKYHRIVDTLIKQERPVTADYTSQCVTKLIKLSVGGDIEQATVKKDFQNLNRIYSMKLIENKVKWEPIVAKIRTALETM